MSRISQTDTHWATVSDYWLNRFVVYMHTYTPPRISFSGIVRNTSALVGFRYLSTIED